MPLGFAGCGMVFQGSAQNVNVVSVPDSARVELDGYTMGTTPTKVHLERKRSHVVTLQKLGYQRDTVSVRGSMHPVWAGLDVLSGAFPVVLDGASGDWKRFDPEIHASLVRLEPGAPESTGAVLGSATQDDSSQADQGSDWLPAGQTLAAIGGRAQVTCHPRASSAWLGDAWAEIHFRGGATVSNHAHGTFHDRTMHVVQGESFYVLLPGGEMFRVRLMEASRQGASIEWSRP
jgi:hypothetical protein